MSKAVKNDQRYVLQTIWFFFSFFFFFFFLFFANWQGRLWGFVNLVHYEGVQLRSRDVFSWKCGKLRKTAKGGCPALILPFRTSLFSVLSWKNLLHIELQSLKLLKTTKDMFYKQFDFFFFFFFLANWQGRLWGFVNLVHYDGVQLRSRDVMKYCML